MNNSNQYISRAKTKMFCSKMKQKHTLFLIKNKCVFKRKSEVN